MDLPLKKTVVEKLTPKKFIAARIKKTANRGSRAHYMLKINRKILKLTFLKKLNFSRHGYKSTSSLTDGPTLKKNSS